MSPPDDTDTAEIYVEVSLVIVYEMCSLLFLVLQQHSQCQQGKRKMVDGFIRWCERANVGLNQVTTVKEVTEESPTGLYDGFYVKTH